MGTPTIFSACFFQAVNLRHSGFYNQQVSLSSCPLKEYISGTHSFKNMDPHDSPQRMILHLDMDSFYASIEVRYQPDLVGKPVVVGADPKQGKGRGVVSTCSYEARVFGIHSAMPVSQAFTLCPHAIFLPPDFAKYTRASAEVMKILGSYGYPLEQVSIDEAFLDVSPLGNYDEARSLAEVIRTTIQQRLGLSCSIGIAPSKLVA
jgi:DNA polymerase IV (archaeal DinB-like DNA polymerase)